MDNQKDDILEEQRRAREEFIKLKKMQHGEIEPEPKPSEIEVKPKTFAQKLSNFWYHFKIQTIICVSLIIVIAFSVVQCAKRPKYDFEIMYFTYTVAVDSQTDAIKNYFEKFVTDSNGDGKVEVGIKNCSVTDNNKDVSRTTMFSKISAIIASEEKIVVYIVDDKALDYFSNAFKNPIFDGEPIELGKDFYEKTTIGNISLPKGLKIVLRRLDGTTFEKSKTAQKSYKAGKDLIEKIKKQSD